MRHFYRVFTMCLTLLIPAAAANAGILNTGVVKADKDGKYYDTGHGLTIYVKNGQKRNCSVAGKSYRKKNANGTYDTSGLYYQTGYGVSIFVKEGQALNNFTKPCKKPSSNGMFDREYSCSTKGYDGRIIGNSFHVSDTLARAEESALSYCEQQLNDSRHCAANITCLKNNGQSVGAKSSDWVDPYSGDRFPYCKQGYAGETWGWENGESCKVR